MNRIEVNGRVWYQGSVDVAERNLDNPDIDVILYLGKTIPYSMVDAEKTVIHVPVNDGVDNPYKWNVAWHAAYTQILFRKRLLICCAAGQSRSPFLCALIIKTLNKDMCLDEAIEAVKKFVPETYICLDLMRTGEDADVK